MRLRYLAVAGAVIACASLYLLMPRPSASVEFTTEAAAASVDFDSLHAQAAAALESLEQSRAQRVASADAAGS
jgi:hypothetical protein